MKSIIRISFLLLFSFLFLQSAHAQKKVRTFSVSKTFDISADKIWAVIGEDYGAVANSHPKIISSNYVSGTLKAGEGAERICNFNKKGTKYLKEKMVNYDPGNMTFTNQVYQSGRFPVDPDYTKAVYKVTDLGNGKSKLTFDMQFRTKPAFMGAMAKGNFKKLIRDYMISIEHHARTGEKVTKANFKKIKKKYS